MKTLTVALSPDDVRAWEIFVLYARARPEFRIEFTRDANVGDPSVVAVDDPKASIEEVGELQSILHNYVHSSEI